MQNIILDIFKSAAYPPTEDQLNLVGFLGNNLWFLRILSLFLILASLFLWFKIVRKITTKLVAWVGVLIVFLTPTFYILWLAYPWDCLKIFLLSALVYLLREKRKILIITVTIFLIGFNFLVTKERSSFVHKLGLNDAKTEVSERFVAEDSLTDPVAVPLKIKRIVYNKYFFEYKEIISEIIPFLDMESLFYQEIHPLEQKSVVLFVWPELFLLIGGIYILIKKKDKKLNYWLSSFLFLSLVNFLFDPFDVFRKFEIILLPLGLVMALAVEETIKTKIVFGKVVGGLLIFLSAYGILANQVDLNKRPDYWLNNRPYFFEFVFDSIKNKNLNEFNKIYVSSLVGPVDKYCQYYLKDCDKFVFDSFELKETRPEKNTIYAGFAGEFIGSDFKNNINNDWLTLIKDKGFTNLETIKLRDTIAYKFGNDVVIGEAK